MPGKKDYVSISKNVHQQKRLLLSNLKELFISFKQKHEDIKIGYSKFCSLRPKWCILPGANGTHSVCVCTYHQNTKLLVEAMNSGDSYKDLLQKLVCFLSNKECMLGRCEQCPDRRILIDYLYDYFNKFDDDHMIFYTQWDHSDRSTLSKMVSDIPTFIEKLTNSLEDLKPHSFISKSQSKYLSELKENLDGSSVIFLGDFSENFSLVVKDEVQSFNWNNMMCTIHTVVIYYKNGNTLSHLSYTIISEDNTHDVDFVYKVIEIIILDLKVKLPNLSFIHFFTDGCAGQYKNHKNMFNLCQLEFEFAIKGEWNFFATSHGKSPCDGIGGTIKRLTTIESLKRTINNQILTAKDMHLFCSEKIKNIISIYLSKEEMLNIRAKHAKRYDILNAIPGTRSYHQFTPLSRSKIGAKRCSIDSNLQSYIILIIFIFKKKI